MTRKNISKDSPVFHVLGTLDELSSALGVARSEMGQQTGALVQALQQDLILFCTDLAGGTPFPVSSKLSAMEHGIDSIMSSVPESKHFIVSGDSKTGASLHLARTIARRAERELIAFRKSGGASKEMGAYINRLSDMIYAIARLADLEKPSVPFSVTQSNENFHDRADILCQAVLTRARQLGLKIVIAICDAGGHLVRFSREDGSYIASVDVAINKAFTAVSLQMDTETVGNLCKEGQPFYGLQFTNNGKMVVFGGGVPLYRNGILVGAIGISGGTAAQDTELAQWAKEQFG